MMIILNFLVLVFVQYCASDDGRSPFEWNLKTIEHGSDFADNSRVTTFDKNEFQKKFFNTPGKANDDDIFEKMFHKPKDNKFEWKENNGNYKKKFDYNDRNPFYFSQKPFTKNVPDFADNEFSKKSFHSPDRTYNENNVFDKISFKKMDNNIVDWKANSGNFKKNFDLNEKNSFSFIRKPFTNDDNTQEQYKTNSIFSQNIDNDRGYPGANTYGDYEDKNANDFGLNSKYSYFKEPKSHKTINNNNHYDKDDEDFQDFNITNYENQEKRFDLHRNNKAYSFLPFFSQRIKNFTSNIVCDKYNEKNKNKAIEKEGQKVSLKDKQKDNEKNSLKGDTAVASNCSGKYEEIEGFVGTNLIDNIVKRCFSTEEVALLATRRDFESLLPKDLPQCLFNDRMVEVLFNYFYACHQMIIGTTSGGLMRLTQKAFYDTLGGYLNYYMVPVAKYSYYAGQISLRTAQQVLILHHQCKGLLNTNGNGWKGPIHNVLLELKSIQIEPLHIPPLNEDLSDEPSFCMHLDLITEECQPHDDKMIVRQPKLEGEDLNGFLGNVWLPFRRKRIFDLKADSAAYVLVKFYETVTKCYRYENIDQTYYNSHFKSWLIENIHAHLSDDQFYPGLGAVLRIYEYLNRIKKDTTASYRGPNNIKQQIKHMKRANNKILHNNGKIIIDYDLFNSNQTNRKPKEDLHRSALSSSNSNLLSKDAGDDQQQSSKKSDEDSDASDSDESNPKIDIRAGINLTPVQAVIIGIPVLIFSTLVMICCYKSFCKKKKKIVVPPKQSSSSSSNLFNSPVRFFHVRPKTISECCSSGDTAAKKSKKSVKIEKKTAMRSDTSASSSPVRKPDKPKGKCAKSNVYL